MILWCLGVCLCTSSFLGIGITESSHGSLMELIKNEDEGELTTEATSISNSVMNDLYEENEKIWPSESTPAPPSQQTSTDARIGEEEIEDSSSPTLGEIEGAITMAEMTLRMISVVPSAMHFTKVDAGKEQFTLDADGMKNQDSEAALQLLGIVKEKSLAVSNSTASNAFGALALRETLLSFKFPLHDIESKLEDLTEQGLDARFESMRERIFDILSKIPHFYRVIDEIVLNLSRAVAA